MSNGENERRKDDTELDDELSVELEAPEEGEAVKGRRVRDERLTG